MHFDAEKRASVVNGRKKCLQSAINLLAATVLAILLLPQATVRATNHENHIEEVMAGANGDSRVQFIIIRQEGGGNLWGPQSGESQSRTMLVFFDAAGRETGKFEFPRNPPNQPSNNATLIATQAFANISGAPAPDFIISPLLNAISGKVCFMSNPANPNASARLDCVSYGNFSGDTGTSDSGVVFGSPAAALPIVNTVSLRRPGSAAAFGSTPNSSFVINPAPTPTNAAGVAFTMPSATQVVQGQTLFNNETFLGNGRTCASCHIASESFRLPPANIQSRFSSLFPSSLSYDPLFIGETVPSSFDGGFDFNLNTLVLTAPISSDMPCPGDLQGIITSNGGGRAKVLALVSPTTYLVYGGMSPALSGTVVDGNSCSGTVSSITAGSLGDIVASGVPGLEDPLRMRTSVSPDFPQGRGLIMENIDGFSNPAVFRKSPHLLNLSRTAPFGYSGNIPDLQTFAQGAVQQHLPRTLARSLSSNPDFRLPTSDELAAMEAFMLAQEFPPGSDPDKFNLDRFAITPAQQRGRAAFFGTAKCSMCHGGTVLAQTTVAILDQPAGVNGVFNIGVANQAINSSSGDNLPCEPSTPSVGPCGSRRFNVPQLFNVKNLVPLFHDASASTVQEAVEFYRSAAFNNSEAGIAIGGIAMSSSTIDDITAFLEGLTLKKAGGQLTSD